MEHSPDKTNRWLLIMIGVIAVAVVVLILSQKKPAEWKKIGEGPGLTYYADLSSIRKADKSKTILLLADNTTAQLDNGKSYLSSKQQYEIDCKDTKKRLVSFALYAEKMGAGNEVAASSLTDQEWSPAPPNTVAGAMWELSCNQPWWKFWG